jgi:GT2 family glycosyltransferase
MPQKKEAEQKPKPRTRRASTSRTPSAVKPARSRRPAAPRTRTSTRATPPDQPPAGPRVSVVVPVFNSATMIHGLVDALSKQTIEDFEAVFVDDGSTDGTADILEGLLQRIPANMKLVRMPANGGPAAARNAGLRATSAPIVAFTDSDCLPAPDWLEQGLIAIRDDADGIEGQTLPTETPSATTHQMINTSGGLFMTCNMIYRREALERAQGFDERFRLAFLEDSDVAFSILETGGVIPFEPSVLVRHLVLERGTRKFGNEARKRFYNPLLFKKHPAMYRQYITNTVPGLPPLHLKYMLATLALPAPIPFGLPGVTVFLLVPFALFAKRVLHAYKAGRDPRLWLRALGHPWHQTWHVLRGAWHFKAFSVRL